MQKLLLFITIPLIGFSQSRPSSQPLDWKKEHISVGFFSHKTGYSLIGYTKNIYRNKNHNRQREFFIALGTNIIQNSFAFGLKKQFLESGLNKTLYSSVSIKGVYGVGKFEDFIAPVVSIGLDIPIAHHRDYMSYPAHPIIWPLKPFMHIRNLIARINPGIDKKEFVNIGISSTIRFNNKIRLVTIPHLNLSYRW